MTGKRLGAVCLTLLLCLGLAVPALAAEEDFVIEDGNLKEYHGPGGKVVIPDGVRWVDFGAFAWREDITEVTFPEGLTSIVDCAFWSCTGLREVTVPKSVRAIGSSAFYGCTGLERVTYLGDGVVEGLSIENGAFSGCTSLSEVDIPSTTLIMEEAFADTPWQAEQDRHKALPIETVRAIVCVVLGSVAAAFIVKKRNTQKK